MQSLCFGASSVVNCAGGDQVFAVGEELPHAILLTRGTIEYSYVQEQTYIGITRLDTGVSDGRDEGQHQLVSATCWICQLALVVKWHTLGKAQAQSASEMVLVSVEEFLKVVMAYPQVAVFAAQYATQLASHFLQTPAQSKDGTVAYTDVDPGFDCDEIVAQMHHAIRGLVSLPLLEMLRRNQSLLGGLWARKAFADLEAEVLKGRCHVSMGPDGMGSIFRVVRVVVIHLTNADGLLCVQLAETKKEGTACNPKFGLPGQKVAGGETPEVAMRKLLAEQLHSLLPAMSDEIERETVTETVNSASFGLQTKYIKTIFKLKLSGHLVRVAQEGPSKRPQSECTPQTTSSEVASTSIVHPFGSGAQAAQSGSSGKRGSRGHMRSPPRPGILRADSLLDGSPSLGSTDTVSSVCGHSIDADGAYNGFAVKAKGTDEGDVTDSQATTTTRQYPLKANIYLYRWLAHEQYQSLISRREEVEHSLRPVIKGFTVQQWQKVLAWRVVSDPAVVFEPFSDDVDSGAEGTDDDVFSRL